LLRRLLFVAWYIRARGVRVVALTGEGNRLVRPVMRAATRAILVIEARVRVIVVPSSVPGP
jgi:hypothetical protein